MALAVLFATVPAFIAEAAFSAPRSGCELAVARFRRLTTSVLMPRRATPKEVTLWLGPLLRMSYRTSRILFAGVSRSPSGRRLVIRACRGQPAVSTVATALIVMGTVPDASRWRQTLYLSPSVRGQQIFQAVVRPGRHVRGQRFTCRTLLIFRDTDAGPLVRRRRMRRDGEGSHRRLGFRSRCKATGRRHGRVRRLADPQRRGGGLRGHGWRFWESTSSSEGAEPRAGRRKCAARPPYQR